jgi:hypothetical protein
MKDSHWAKEYKKHFKISGKLKENDDDLFANRTVINPVSLARGIVQVAEEFEDRADRVSTWDAAESYRDDAAVLRVAARACGSGLRACMSELTAIDDPNSWDYLIEVLQQDFDIDLSSLYDQYENGDLPESVTESDDDLFAPSDRIEQIERARKDPEWAYEYARDKLKRRWPAAEPYIMRDPYWAQEYADRVIKGRWPEAEPVIMQDPMSAYFYACLTIGGRWLEAEPVILQSQSEWANGYKEHFNIQDDLTENDDDLFADPRNSINLSKLTNSSLNVLFDAFRFESRPEYLPKVRRQMKKIAREFEQRGQPMPTAVLQQYDLTEDK